MNARFARLVDAYYGRADSRRVVHHFADFARRHFRRRAANDGEVHCENEYLSTVNVAVAGDDAIAIESHTSEAESGGMVTHKRIDLVEAAGIEQFVDSFAGGELAFFVLRLNTSLATAKSAFALALS